LFELPSTTKNACDVVTINKFAMLSIILHSKDDSSIYIDDCCLGPHVAKAGEKKSIGTCVPIIFHLCHRKLSSDVWGGILQHYEYERRNFSSL